MRGLCLALAALGVAAASTPADLVAGARTSVVRVEATGRAIAPELEAMLGQLPQAAVLRPGSAQGQRGAGVVVADGVLTSHHVVAGASAVRLIGPDGVEAPGRVVAFDADLDLAWVAPTAELRGLRPITWGSSDDLAVGSTVLALGYPLGPELTVTGGVLGGRTERSLLGRGRRTWLVTDALIRRGASGGPLLDPEGRVVGLNTGGVEADADGGGLGFVMPSEAAQAALAGFRRVDRDRRLGVRVVPADDGVRVVHSLGEVLRADDVLTAVAGSPVQSLKALALAVQRSEGAEVTVEGRRQGEPTTWTVPLLAPSGTAPFRWRGLGLTPDGDGLVVASVTPQASRLGLDIGDRVVAVGDEALRGQTLRGQLQGTPAVVALTVEGKGLVWMLPPS